MVKSGMGRMDVELMIESMYLSVCNLGGLIVESGIF
jgi:hypothetical protein